MSDNLLDSVGEVVEEWRVVPEHPSYEVSNHGQVRRRYAKGRWKAGHILRPGQSHSGHLYVIITNGDGLARKQFVHRLVAAAFVGPCPFEGAYVLHHDDVPTNNRPENLYWGDHSQNVKDARLNRKSPGEVSQQSAQPGEENSSAILSVDDVLEIKKRLAQGLCGSCLARLYGVKKETIYSIAKRRTWAQVGTENGHD